MFITSLGGKCFMDGCLKEKEVADIDSPSKELLLKSDVDMNISSDIVGIDESKLKILAPSEIAIVFATMLVVKLLFQE